MPKGRPLSVFGSLFPYASDYLALMLLTIFLNITLIVLDCRVLHNLNQG